MNVANINVPEDGSQTVPAVRIDGKVHGGAYPLQKATVILMETQSNGVWTAANNAYVGTAKPLYVTTSDTHGSFSFPDTGWTCDAGQYVYIEVTGGYTASSTNANVVQLGVVGDCAADLGSIAKIDGVNVFISEPSTVAAAYALHSFLSIHSGNLTGVASDGTATLGTTIPLADITAPLNNNAVSASPSLNPSSTAASAVQVPLSSVFNTTGIYTDGSTFSTSGGLDNDGFAYSSALVGSTLTYGGVSYVLGSANQPDAIQSKNAPVIPLTSGSFNTLNLLGAAVNGNQTGQTFTVTYTDGTTTNFTQSISDWYTPQNYTGEATALTTSYRDTAAGGTDARNFLIYQYSFTLNRAKVVKSLTLPNNTNVVILALTETSNLPVCNGIRTGTALSCTAAGLAHGFRNAYNLVDQLTFSSSQFPSGVSRTTLPGNSKALAPREMLNTLGNILQECVDSNGGTVTPSYAGYATGTSPCGDLFYYTTPPSSTTSPTNTLQAAINLATYPTNNVTQLMALKPRNVFFSPEISQPTSPQAFAFTLSVFYQGTGLGDTFTNPTNLALDVQDNLYITYGKNSGTVDELTAGGSGVFTQAVANVTNPKSLATDNNGYVWLTDDTAVTNGTGSAGGVTGLYTTVNATKSLPAGTTYKTVAMTNGSAAGLAFDASSNMFLTRDSNDGNPGAFLYTAASSYGATGSASYTLNYPMQRAVADSLGNFFATGSNGSSSEWLVFTYATCGTGTAPAVSTLSSSGGMSLAMNDNTGTSQNYSFVPSSGQVTSLRASGSCTAITISSAAGTKTGLSSTAPAGAVMDGSLNLFWIDSASGLLYNLAGAGSSTNISNATATTLAPCYYTGSSCASTSSAKSLGLAIDSSGAIWSLSQGSSYGLVQTFGVAAPTWPLLASENSGVTVQ